MDSANTTTIRTMRREELNAYATHLGIAGAEGFANKDDLVAAIEADLAAGKSDATDGLDSDDVGGGDGESSSATDDADAEPAAGDRFRVLKAFTLDDGRTVMPGEEFSPSEAATWPARRSKQMVDQKYLRPLD